MTEKSVTIAHGVVCIVTAILLLSTLPQHVRVKNVGTLSMIAWGVIGTICEAVTDFLLMNTVESLSPSVTGWCDFSSTIQYVFPFGFSIGMLLVLRRLEAIASTRHANADSDSKRRIQIIEIVVVICLPLLLIPLHFVVQGSRFVVIENYGCVAPIYPTIPAVFIYLIWQPLLNTTNLLYAMLVLRWFLMRRRQFAAILHSSGAGISKRKYIRLMILVITELAWAWPISIFVFIYNVKTSAPFLPYKSWDNIHDGFDDIVYVDVSGASSIQKATIELGRWSAPFFAFCFWLFFGLSADSLREQKLVLSKVWRASKIRVTRPSSSLRGQYVGESFATNGLQSYEKGGEGSVTDTMTMTEIPFSKHNQGFHAVTIETDKFVV